MSALAGNSDGIRQRIDVIVVRSGEVGVQSFEAVELATLEWVDWFNNRRLLEPIGNIPPVEAEERHYAMLEQSDMAA